MNARAKLLGHPIHQMLIVFPLGLFAASFIFDIVFLVTHNPELGIVSYWMIGAGIIGGVLAAGVWPLDWAGLSRGPPGEGNGMPHRLRHVLLTPLFMLRWVPRRSVRVATPPPDLIFPARHP